MDPRERERLLVLETKFDAVQEKLQRAEEDLREVPILRERLERYERASMTVADNVLEMQQRAKVLDDNQKRIIVIIERQARASENIEAQLVTRLDMIMTHASGAKQVAEKAAEHAGKAAENTSKFPLYDPSAPKHEIEGGKSNKHWVPRTIAGLQKWTWRTWLPITIVLLFVCIGLALFYGIEKTAKKSPAMLAAPQIENRK
mgnify:CR=1 FL=1